MPVYGFRCVSCDKEWTELMSMSDYSDHETFTCSHCGAEQTRDSRNDIGEGLSTSIKGVSKGKYNSNDWS